MHEAYRKVPPLAESQRATATGLEAPGSSTWKMKNKSITHSLMMENLGQQYDHARGDVFKIGSTSFFLPA